MSTKLRLVVPIFWVLLPSVISAVRASSSLSTQFWSTEHPPSIHFVNQDISRDLETSDDHCTEPFQSCSADFKMPNFTIEHKQIVKSLYKEGKRFVHSESHVRFLSECLSQKIIPKTFKVQTVIPGNKKKIQEKFDEVSFVSICDEKEPKP